VTNARRVRHHEGHIIMGRGRHQNPVTAGELGGRAGPATITATTGPDRLAVADGDVMGRRWVDEQ
jgi:hypothetical protein